MITHLQGRLTEKTPTYVVIDCNGVGYFVNISLYTFSKIPETAQIFLYTYLQIKEDAHTLFGFYDKAERDIFTLLLSVSGVGASTARIMLSSLSPAQVQQAIINGDVGTIQSVKGIGAKTAQRIILDLREKMIKLEGLTETSSTLHNTGKEEAIAALEVLGYPRKVTEKVVQKIITQASEPLSVENIIKQALKLV
ncbi:Holliday junction branch migration protein RuvA [Capnocytophaga catalasegens]|uniref:Holliday junction branch migration complex subunit RuvA n=1 Tax=Capnocytophaga catalasegens TaxID=1004260 RepID=A0AAV5AUG7_9FLAO|nr:Holliday junction branch migration protein RuvA [Capnocytophaga catalasegens]GIZ16135.1 Holliday junction ATP-dependent DNA helicase RuvA [Capnocytophaga catalasegens]GJM50921.1 Holliday junction ATP-dependent DNA helicase RuvA [Capnocytophaga catalasegens]GJM53765.1 Holliday junction ATP-dependent DNA helicase RuvA [Capnocytophaga catalasegens]